MRDVAALGLAIPISKDALAQRADRLAGHADRVREVIEEQNEPILLGDAPGGRGPH